MVYPLFVARGSARTLLASSSGPPGTRRLVADFDGDGKSDLTVYRPRRVSGSFDIVARVQHETALALPVGLSGGHAALADFDGDGKSELTVYRTVDGRVVHPVFIPGYSTNSFGHFQWVWAETRRPWRLDGDGRAELTVYRPGTGEWFLRIQASLQHRSFAVLQWGARRGPSGRSGLRRRRTDEIAVYGPRRESGTSAILAGLRHRKLWVLPWGTGGDLDFR